MLEGCEASERLEPFRVIVGVDEGLEMLTELIVAGVMIPSDCCLFECSVHPLDLPIGPGMVRFRQPMLDTLLGTDPIKQMPHHGSCRAVAVTPRMTELDAVIS